MEVVGFAMTVVKLYIPLALAVESRPHGLAISSLQLLPPLQSNHSHHQGWVESPKSSVLSRLEVTRDPDAA